MGPTLPILLRGLLLSRRELHKETYNAYVE